MAQFKLVLCGKDGKCSQKEVKDTGADFFLKKRLGDKVNGSDVGMEGYEFEITGGSDKCGFPMRKGILQVRQRVKITGKGVGCCGKSRKKKTQKGLMRKRTVCGERISNATVQINLKVLKEGKAPLGGAPEGETAESPKEEAKEAPKTEEKAPEEKKEEVKAEAPKEEAKAEEKPAEETKKEEPEPKEIKKAEESSEASDKKEE